MYFCRIFATLHKYFYFVIYIFSYVLLDLIHKKKFASRKNHMRL